ncbi:MAG: hypothetical protein GX166_04785 [Clostridiaceae bacterium]|jgi:molybdopterin converting factor small subunit|nr:hypothetical protein [Clostridiaceae bacterium]
MVITVELFHTLKKYCKERFKDDENSFELSIDGREEILLDELVSFLNIPDEEVGFATINNVKHNWNDPIKDGDRIKIFPVIIAG